MTVTDPYAEQLAAIPVRRRTIEIEGAPTFYWEYGPDDAETTLLAVHGFRGDHHGLEPIVAHLPGIKVISPDLPGFGASPRRGTGAHDLPGYASWLCAIAEALRFDGPVLGHSFGSIVVAGALERGLPASRVVLVNPIAAPALSGPRGVLTRLAVFYYWAGARLPRPIGEWLLRSRVIVRVMSEQMAKTGDRALRAFIHDQHHRYFSEFADRDLLREAFLASVSHDVSEYAGSLTAPTLLIAADRDDITPIDAVRRFAGSLPDVRLVELAGVGHLIHYEKPAEAAAAIRDFLG